MSIIARDEPQIALNEIISHPATHASTVCR